jgi:hypothetical protein
MSRWALCVLLLACSRPAKEESREVPGIVVDDTSITVRAGLIGAENKKQATYALADVENQTKEDRLVAIEGHLVGPGQEDYGRLVGGEIRVPAGGVRAFAVIADDERPGATGAKLRVHHATVVDYPESVLVVGAKQDAVGEFQVATAEIRNTTEKDAMASVIAAYYDDAGRVISRPFVIIAIPAKGMRPVRFEGAKTAARSSIFVGDVTF